MVWAIRGATTVSNNDADEILTETQNLLKEMAQKNGLAEDDIISIIFTVTKDLDAAFPAIAARNIGWTSTALMCMNEIDVPGSLKKCIRIMMHVNSDKDKKDIKHVYLNGAKVLRPDLT
ncbi:chorismate mutase [Acetivibrio straminisolvens]|jgi:chorismate mutase|uniref:chorismate mutase n=1 Tax=Acetivibrio straminisolvens JCM 21531 TaxID=1294263 RepID=W4V780_9FIRM|nr:chorismate mutase [Acetivibrio straminisolvens]GAE89036.1 chorismate mutase II [Acetivibrio straminisolvens JCM 21531]